MSLSPRRSTPASTSVTATVTQAGYAGTATGVLAIARAPATVTLSNTTRTYNGSALSPSVTTAPANLATSLTGAPQTNPGTYSVSASVTDPNYTGTASGSFTIVEGPTDVAVFALTATPNPVGRLRTIVYTITAINNSAVQARAVSVTDTPPANTTFVSATASQGSISSAPPVGGTGKVTVNLGSIAPGVKPTVTITLTVGRLAAATINNTVDVANTATDPTPANNTKNITTNVVDVGTFELTPATSSVEVKERTRLTLAWTLPGTASWRELTAVELRLRDAGGVVFWVRVVEGKPMLLSLFNEDAGTFLASKSPGDPSVLSGAGAQLHLASTTVTAAGPTAPTAVMSLDVEFKKGTEGRQFVVEVQATDDLGNAQAWQPAGTLTVTARR